MKQQRRFTALPILAALIFVCGPARADTVTIDCDDPNLPSSTPIQDTLAEGRVLVIQGICNTEPEIVIRFDDVTLVGNGTIVGQVTVGGAQRFALRNVTVANSPEIGVYIIDGASAEISNVTVENANDSGIDVRHGSFARILDSRIEHNIWGLSVNKGGVVDGYRNVIANNAQEQVDLAEHGTYRGTTERIDQGIGTYALSVTRNSYLNLRRGSSVTGETSLGLQSHIRTRDDTSVRGNIYVDLQSALDVAEQSAIEGDIEARNLSIVRLLGDAMVDGTVRCYRTSICIEE